MQYKRKILIYLGITLVITLTFFIFFIAKSRLSENTLFALNGKIVSSDIFYDVIDRSAVEKYSPLHPYPMAAIVNNNVLLIVARKTSKYHAEYFIEFNAKPFGPFIGEPRYWVTGDDIVIVASTGNNSKFIFVNDKQIGPFTYVMDRRHIINGQHAFVVATEEGTFVLYGEKRFGPFTRVGELHELNQSIAFKACTNCTGDFQPSEDWYVIYGNKKYGPYDSVFSQEYNDILIAMNEHIVFPARKNKKIYIVDDGKEVATQFKNEDEFYQEDERALFLNI